MESGRNMAARVKPKVEFVDFLIATRPFYEPRSESVLPLVITTSCRWLPTQLPLEDLLSWASRRLGKWRYGSNAQQ